MALDTGAVTHSLLRSAGVDMGDVVEIRTPALEGAMSVGAALRAARLHHGLSLQDVSDVTCIKRSYLEALEDMRVEDLPSRPFTVGYIRAFAKVVDINPEAAVERFKEDSPDRLEPLRAPVGVRKRGD